ncbi:MAG: hypothetical protein D3916_00945 [Candidatus Electrothrix sp. MAN1_4]|nr:hypothetical protein [Candidatus Electrothrix sp. MAN1_4]
MAREKNPEDEKEVSPITRVLLNDLKGMREVRLDFNKKNQYQKARNTAKKKDVSDNAQWMPKNIPNEMKKLINETEKPKLQKGVAVPKKQKVSVRKQREKFEYLIQLKSGKALKSKKVIVKGGNVILINEKMKIKVPASSIKWIKESRVRIMTLQ